MTVLSVSNSFTRPNNTTAYAVGDLVANSTASTDVTAVSFLLPTANEFTLQRATIDKTSTTTNSALFRLYLYNSSPTVVSGDNGVYSSTVSGYLGDISIDCRQRSFSDAGKGWGFSGITPTNAGTWIDDFFHTIFGGSTPTIDSDISVYITSQSSPPTVYGLLRAMSTYTPSANEVFNITLYGSVAS